MDDEGVDDDGDDDIDEIGDDGNEYDAEDDDLFLS